MQQSLSTTKLGSICSQSILNSEKIQFKETAYSVIDGSRDVLITLTRSKLKDIKPEGWVPGTGIFFFA